MEKTSCLGGLTCCNSVVFVYHLSELVQSPGEDDVRGSWELAIWFCRVSIIIDPRGINQDARCDQVP